MPLIYNRLWPCCFYAPSLVHVALMALVALVPMFPMAPMADMGDIDDLASMGHVVL